MARDREERNRIFGLPLGDPHVRQGEEPQHAFGIPVDWFGSIDLDWLRSLAHPIREYRRWRRRRRLGPYALDDDEPRPKG